MKKLSIKRIPRWFRRLSRKQKLIVILLAIAIIAALAYLVFGSSKKQDEPEVPPEPVYSQLMGIEVDPEVAERPILGIMIENSTFARPQTGVGSAGIVFESVTEGGITRYLTMFQENFPKEVGPVRSIRPYFVNWMMGFDTSIAHVGGSAPALDLVEQRNAKTLSQFAYPEPYYRRSDRESPHDMYARTKDLRDLQQKLGHKTAEFKEIPRSADSPSQTPNATKININYSGPDFAVEFRYDKTSNSYKRFLAGTPDVDADTKKQITVKNLVVLKMSGPIVEALGTGQVVIYKDGTFQKATWKQSTFRERVVLADSQGNEIPLNRGNTWFAVVPSTGSATH